MKFDYLIFVAGFAGNIRAGWLVAVEYKKMFLINKSNYCTRLLSICRYYNMEQIAAHLPIIFQDTVGNGINTASQ